MEAIYPITALQKNTAEIKAKARKQLVHVTENGAGAFVFASEEVLDQIIARERADAAQEALLFEAIDAGLADIEAGRVSIGWDELEARVEELRKERRESFESSEEELEVAYA